jgi:hypothetical protein
MIDGVFNQHPGTYKRGKPLFITRNRNTKKSAKNIYDEWKRFGHNFQFELQITNNINDRLTTGPMKG